MASATITVLRKSLMILEGQSKSPPWPEAAQCCSGIDLDHPETTKKCWIMQGPAAVTCSSIEQQIMLRLKERERDLYKRRKSSIGYSVKFYMAGTDKENSRPTVLIVCKSKSFGRRIQKLIEDNTWWVDFCNENAALGGFLHVERQPSYLAHIGNLATQAYAYVRKDASTCSGITLFMWTDHGVTTSPSTLGGFVLVDDVLLGLTVSHSMENNTAANHIDSDDTSMQSCSDSNSCSTDSDISDEEPDNTPTNTPSHSQVSAVDLLHPNGEYCMLGVVCSRSVPNPADASDWALVRPNNIAETQLSKQKTAIYASIGVMSKDTTTKVFLVRDGKILTDGMLSTAPSIVCLPGSRRPMFLYSVTTSLCLQVGDCGTWVIDDQGNWYGHVIAGELGSHIIYIAEASNIIEDVKKHCEAENIHVLLPELSELFDGESKIQEVDDVSTVNLTSPVKPMTDLSPEAKETNDLPFYSDFDAQFNLLISERENFTDYSADIGAIYSTPVHHEVDSGKQRFIEDNIDNTYNHDTKPDRKPMSSTKYKADRLLVKNAKRLRSDSELRTESEDSDYQPISKRMNKRTPTEPSARLACHFFKLDPQHYSGKRYPRCTVGFRNNAEIRDHIRKKHSAPEHLCHRCHKIFRNASHKSMHERALEPCKQRQDQTFVEERYIMPGSIRQIRFSRMKKPIHISQAQHWYHVWEVLFPEFPAPENPCIHLETKDAQLARIGEALIQKAIQIPAFRDSDTDTVSDKQRDERLLRSFLSLLREDMRLETVAESTEYPKLIPTAAAEFSHAEHLKESESGQARYRDENPSVADKWSLSTFRDIQPDLHTSHITSKFLPES